MAAEADQGGMGKRGADEEINLEQLKQLKDIFEEADEDGSGELDIDEFTDKLGPHLGAHLTKEVIKQLFMKIDADAGGTVDWDEFTNYMFLERAQNTNEGNSENWKLFPQNFRDKNDPGSSHRGAVDRMMYCEVIDKYVTCARDGTFRLWNGSDLRHFKTVVMGSSWITDTCYMPAARKLVFTTVDRAISYYEANRGSYELSGRVYASGLMGVPQTLTLVTNDAGEQIVYGDSKGAVVMLLCGTREWPARDLISTEDHQDYIYIHQEHMDWVSKVLWVPEVGLVSSSLDATIKIYDFVREKVINTCTHHTKGVHGFAWCRAYSMFASCGLERDVMLWQGNTMRRIGELTGHTASVTHIALDEKLNQVFTLAADKVIKVWDLRTHKCLQTIISEDWARVEESKPHCLIYDASHRRVVTVVNKPVIWLHKLVAQDRTGHMDPVRGALYNRAFCVIVSTDEAGTVCVWNIMTGTREGRFTNAHGDKKVTAMTFDKNERRLLTAASDGSVRMWNFNNGSLLRQYKHDLEPEEISTVIFAADEKRGDDAVYAAGWNCKVLVWEDLDDDADVIEQFRTYDGHREDILHMAAEPERQLLATGDYEGRINIWTLFTGERKMSLYHRAERYETSVERLQWLPIRKPGSKAPLTPQSPLLLLSCGGDGLMRVWLIKVHEAGKLVATVPAAQGRLEHVSAICCDADHKTLVIGDTAGHIRVWDVSTGVDVSSADACNKSFRQRAHWRAHLLGVNCVAAVHGRELIIAGSKDCNVSLWSFDGALVGILGERSWNLDDISTWADPEGKNKRDPMPDTGNLYLQVATGDGNDGGDKEDDGLGDYTPVQMAAMLIQEKKARHQEASLRKPHQVHSMLDVHDLQPVPSTVSELLNHERKKAGRAPAAAPAGPSKAAERSTSLRASGAPSPASAVRGTAAGAPAARAAAGGSADRSDRGAARSG